MSEENEMDADEVAQQIIERVRAIAKDYVREFADSYAKVAAKDEVDQITTLTEAEAVLLDSFQAVFNLGAQVGLAAGRNEQDD